MSIHSGLSIFDQTDAQSMKRHNQIFGMRHFEFVATCNWASACAEDEHDQTGHAPLQLGFHDALRSDERKCKRGKATIRSQRVK